MERSAAYSSLISQSLSYASSLIVLPHECVVLTFSTQEILGAIHASQCECVGVMYVYMYLMALIG